MTDETSLRIDEIRFTLKGNFSTQTSTVVAANYDRNAVAKAAIEISGKNSKPQLLPYLVGGVAGAVGE